ncbi:MULTISPECIES: YjcZ family sporulation protein [Sporosarcina]
MIVVLFILLIIVGRSYF